MQPAAAQPPRSPGPPPGPPPCPPPGHLRSTPGSHRTRRLGDPPPRELLDAAELISVDELRATQLSRLRWTLRQTPTTTCRSTGGARRRGRTPGRLRELADLSRFPTPASGPAGQLPFGCSGPQERVRRNPLRPRTTGRPTVSVHRGRHYVWSPVMARSIRAAGGRPGPKVHNAYVTGCSPAAGCALRPRTTRPTADPGVRRHDAAPGAAHPGSRPDVIMVTPSYLLTVIDESSGRAIDPRSSSLRVAFRRRTGTEQMRRRSRTDGHAQR